MDALFKSHTSLASQTISRRDSGVIVLYMSNKLNVHVLWFKFYFKAIPSAIVGKLAFDLVAAPVKQTLVCTLLAHSGFVVDFISLSEFGEFNKLLRSWQLIINYWVIRLDFWNDSGMQFNKRSLFFMCTAYFSTKRTEREDDKIN